MTQDKNVNGKGPLDSAEIELEKTIGTGARLDYLFNEIRLCFRSNNIDTVSKHIERAEKELSKGGDWERKNKLTVYKGLLALSRREFSTSATLFVSSLATFTACELLSFKDFVFYTIIASLVSMDRSTMKTRILDSPEILSIVGEIPHLREVITFLHECRYADWSRSFVGLIDQIESDNYLRVHSRFITRALRLVAYKQFLLSYKSVTIQMMAGAFGVTPVFIEEELSSFIAAGKLNCKIDRIHQIVESNRLDDPRNRMFAEALKQGDLLLNRIQKLSRVIDV